MFICFKHIVLVDLRFWWLDTSWFDSDKFTRECAKVRGRSCHPPTLHEWWWLCWDFDKFTWVSMSKQNVDEENATFDRKENTSPSSKKQISYQEWWWRHHIQLEILCEGIDQGIEDRAKQRFPCTQLRGVCTHKYPICSHFGGGGGYALNVQDFCNP